MGAEVEMFLKNGMRDIKVDGFCVGEGGGDEEDDDDIELSLLVSPDAESRDVSDPVCDKMGADFGISPKCCSASLTASSCCTPANATTILSGL